MAKCSSPAKIHHLYILTVAQLNLSLKKPAVIAMLAAPGWWQGKPLLAPVWSDGVCPASHEHRHCCYNVAR